MNMDLKWKFNHYIVILGREEISLYPKEFDVLYLLMQYPGWVLSPEQIYEAVLQGDMAGCEHMVYNVKQAASLVW